MSWFSKKYVGPNEVVPRSTYAAKLDSMEEELPQIPSGSIRSGQRDYFQLASGAILSGQIGAILSGGWDYGFGSRDSVRKGYENYQREQLEREILNMQLELDRRRGLDQMEKAVKRPVRLITLPEE